jgi:hypothetical protein
LSEPLTGPERRGLLPIFKDPNNNKNKLHIRNNERMAKQTMIRGAECMVENTPNKLSLQMLHYHTDRLDTTVDSNRTAFKTTMEIHSNCQKFKTRFSGKN